MCLCACKCTDTHSCMEIHKKITRNLGWNFQVSLWVGMHPNIQQNKYKIQYNTIEQHTGTTQPFQTVHLFAFASCDQLQQSARPTHDLYSTSPFLPSTQSSLYIWKQTASPSKESVPLLVSGNAQGTKSSSHLLWLRHRMNTLALTVLTCILILIQLHRRN